MGFTPLVRYRNFTLKNLKSILEVYPDLSKTMKWNEAADAIEKSSQGYKKTAYQLACQFGIENRGRSDFEIHDYLFTFDDKNLKLYIEFWLKTYFAPNPYVASNDTPFIIYCEIVKLILEQPNHEIKYHQFFDERIGGGSRDILLNAIDTFAHPVKIKKAGSDNVMFIEKSDIDMVQKEVEYIENNFAIGDPKDKKSFFDRYSYNNFCDFFNITLDLTKVNEDLELAGLYNDRKTGARNILLYGVPGVGKSHTIKTSYCSDENYMERVVFHPDYTYSDFVGQIFPRVEKTEDGDKLKYTFTPGPFTKVLAKAVNNPNDFFYLIIEELNRGNAPAIFGEIFQLLDRKEEEEYPISEIGESEYGVSNYDIAREVYNNETHQVRIPSNMYILATMNTSDQNVFTLDTAFQRRWDMKQIKNNIELSLNFETLISGTSISWGGFVSTINNLIVDQNIDIASSEDKRLGAYFVKKRELTAESFPEKVIKYLWDDVFKMNKESVFKTDYKTLEDIVITYQTTTGDRLKSVLREDIYEMMLTNVHIKNG